MIPLHLKIKNFLSYADTDQHIDFEPYTLICLSGKNGHGKSALLDALTWAIWGNARKVSGVSRADEALIRLGQDRMSVQCDFLAQGERYRIYRELVSCHGKARTTLEFGLYNEDEKKLKPLTEKTIRATQEKIEKTVGLDFDAFVSTVFLRQGQANEFSKKSARERKEILATILGLDYYERVRKVVLERIRERLSKRDGIDQLLTRLEEETKNEQERVARKQQLKLDEAVCVDKETALLKQQKEARDERECFYADREQLYLLEKNTASTAEDLQRYKHVYELSCAQKYKENEVQGATLVSQLQAAEEKYHYLNKQKKQLCDEQSLLKKNCTAYQEELKEKEVFVLQHKKIQARFERRKDLYQRMIGHGNIIDRELKVLADQQKYTMHDKEDRCPLCEQSLSGETREELHKKLQRKRFFYQHRLKRIGAFVQDSKKILTTDHAAMKVLEEKLQHLQMASSQLVDSSARCVVIDKEIEQYTSLLAQTEKVKRDLNEQLQQNARILKEYKDVHVRELQNDKEYKRLMNSHQEAFQKHQEYTQKISFDKRERALKCLEGEIQQDELIVHTLRNKILQEKTRIEHEEKRIQKCIEECKKYEAIKKQLEEEVAEYKIINEAFGKDGIQALLIESVVPEIEEEANRLLMRLSDQNAQIMIESVRDLKKGGTRETLDIKISDNAGIRPYELFSGGEAFRIDFALRIAISKLLARRAGTSLQTLIIDEGFGSQDEDGLALIMDALYKIQDDFAKIIIVSHLATMKDQFPVHFFIEKTALGSSVRVVEQG